MKIRFIIGLILVLLVVGTGIWISGGSFLLFLDPYSFAIEILASCFVIIMSFSIKEIRTAFAHVFDRETDNTANYRKDIVLFSAMQNIVTTVAITALLMGVIAMLSQLMDAAAIGRGLALALLSGFYALILQLALIIPCKTILRKKQSMQQ